MPQGFPVAERTWGGVGRGNPSLGGWEEAEPITGPARLANEIQRTRKAASDGTQLRKKESAWWGR